MESAIYMNGNKFTETNFESEEDFENIVKQNSKTLFGSKSIYFDLKNKIDTRTFGYAIPDGFLFDFRDEDNTEFYLVEVELEKHDFDKHIFPQIKKFFAFFKNPKSREELTGKLFNYIKSNPSLESEFKKYLGSKEIYKTLKDVIESSQNILLIIDENKPQFEETSDIITEWARFVTIEVLKQYTANGNTVFTLNPDFEKIKLEPVISEESEESGDSGPSKYSESFHTEDKDKVILALYERIKDYMIKIDPSIKVNPQKYYISLRKNKNFAYIQLKKKKMWIRLMLPYEIGNKIIKKHEIIQEVEGVQKFYGGPMFSVMIENEDSFDEILKTIEESYKQQNK